MERGLKWTMQKKIEFSFCKKFKDVENLRGVFSFFVEPAATKEECNFYNITKQLSKDNTLVIIIL